MESETYLTYKEANHLDKLRIFYGSYNFTPLYRMGLTWIFERGQYQIVDEKLWMLAKIKYGF